MSILAIILYLFVTSYVTSYVGKVLFINGRHFLVKMLLNQEHLADSVNRILLVGYYLVNLGYVSIMLTSRGPVITITDLVESLSMSIGKILLTLGIMHFINIATVVIWNKINSKS